MNITKRYCFYLIHFSSQYSFPVQEDYSENVGYCQCDTDFMRKYISNKDVTVKLDNTFQQVLILAMNIDLSLHMT